MNKYEALLMSFLSGAATVLYTHFIWSGARRRAHMREQKLLADCRADLKRQDTRTVQPPLSKWTPDLTELTQDLIRNRATLASAILDILDSHPNGIYGKPLLDLVEKAQGKMISHGQLYATMDQLEEAKLVRSWMAPRTIPPHYDMPTDDLRNRLRKWFVTVPIDTGRSSRTYFFTARNDTVKITIDRDFSSINDFPCSHAVAIQAAYEAQQRAQEQLLA